MVFPPSGLNGHGMGGHQSKQPLFGKEGVWPAVMVQSAAFAAAPATFSENAPQTHADPAVQFTKRVPVAVLEIREPAAQGAVHVCHDGGETVARCAFRLRADCVFELRQAFAAREAAMLHEPVTQKLKAFLPHVND